MRKFRLWIHKTFGEGWYSPSKKYNWNTADNGSRLLSIFGYDLAVGKSDDGTYWSHVHRDGKTVYRTYGHETPSRAMNAAEAYILF
jgi:hypothetical protein